jgi:hypothetical protein
LNRARPKTYLRPFTSTPEVATLRKTKAHAKPIRCARTRMAGASTRRCASRASTPISAAADNTQSESPACVIQEASPSKTNVRRRNIQASGRSIQRTQSVVARAPPRSSAP